MPIFYELKDSFKYAATRTNIGVTYEIQADYFAELDQTRHRWPATRTQHQSRDPLHGSDRGLLYPGA